MEKKRYESNRIEEEPTKENIVIEKRLVSNLDSIISSSQCSLIARPHGSGLSLSVPFIKLYFNQSKDPEKSDFLIHVNLSIIKSEFRKQYKLLELIKQYFRKFFKDLLEQFTSLVELFKNDPSFRKKYIFQTLKEYAEYLIENIESIDPNSNEEKEIDILYFKISRARKIIRGKYKSFLNTYNPQFLFLVDEYDICLSFALIDQGLYEKTLKIVSEILFRILDGHHLIYHKVIFLGNTPFLFNEISKGFSDKKKEQLNLKILLILIN